MSDSTSDSDFETGSRLLRKRKGRDVSPFTRRVQRRRTDDSSTSEGQSSTNDSNIDDSSSDEESITGFRNTNEQLNLRRASEESEDREESKRKKFNLSLKRKNDNIANVMKQHRRPRKDILDSKSHSKLKARIQELLEIPETEDPRGNSAGEPSTSSARVDELPSSSNRSKLRLRTRQLANRINPCVCTSCTRFNN